MNTENEAGEIRDYLGLALDGAEPPLRDLASASIARGDAARRRARVYGAAGVALSAVAVLGVFAAVTGTTPPAKQNPVTPSVTRGSSAAGDGDKARDIDLRLPALLQPLLPAGLTVRAPEATEGRTPDQLMVLTGPGGGNGLGLAVQPRPADVAASGTNACPASLPAATEHNGKCDVVKVSGGRLFSGRVDTTVRNSVADYIPADSLRPGTTDATFIEHAYFAFVPDDVHRGMITVILNAQTMDMPWAATAPADWPKAQGTFPPSMPRAVGAPNAPNGPLMTGSQVAAMLAQPGWAAVEKLLDPATPVSQAALDERAKTDQLIAAKVGAMLPDGTKLVLSSGAAYLNSLDLVGPTGTNRFSWDTRQVTPDFRVRFTQAVMCTKKVDSCSVEKVPGGRLSVVAMGQTSLAGDSGTTTKQPRASKSTDFVYEFLPDDVNAPLVTLRLDVDTTKDPVPDPQVTPVQFLTLAKSAGFGAAMASVTAMVAGL
jgi:hypothetical protein